MVVFAVLQIRAHLVGGDDSSIYYFFQCFSNGKDSIFLYVWNAANSRRGVANDVRDVDDLDSEHYATSLSAFFILFEVRLSCSSDFIVLLDLGSLLFLYFSPIESFS